jgi:mono/diheme cytochrome c family protein
MVRPRLVPCLLVLAALAAAASAQVDAPALFATNCAKCHGLDGSGTGPAVLDRPARNFKEGGFSFGNTPEVIARTIAHGIPGSPMPTFEGALSDAQLQALAAYVVTLGPPVKEVSEAETLMHVTDRPLVVRGILPPLEEGGKLIPRGLLIGTPDGLTFEYAADDVRLLAVRQGDFVKRTDWGERGGTPLEPLGRVVWAAAPTGKPTLWSAVQSRPQGTRGLAVSDLAAQLLSTTTSMPPSIAYALVVPGSARGARSVAATIVETTRSTRLGDFVGFSRHFLVSRVDVGLDSFVLHCPDSMLLFPDASNFLNELAGLPAVRATSSWWTRRIDENAGEVRHVTGSDRLDTWNGSDLSLEFGLWREFGGSSEPIELTIDTFVLSPWNSETLDRFRKVAAR